MMLNQLLNKQVISIFFLRIVGAVLGLLLLSYQYALSNSLRLFFHYFPLLLIGVYIIDFGYSEQITQKNISISYSFLKRIFASLALIVLLNIVVYNLSLPSSIEYLRWLCISALYIPFQVYADVVYRLFLKNGYHVFYMIYQIAYPICTFLTLKFASHLYDAQIALLFVLATVIVQVLFISLTYIRITNKSFLKISKSTSDYEPPQIKAFVLKILPLAIYALCTLLCNQLASNSTYGFEAIRSTYFISGVLLLVLYTNNQNINKLMASNKWIVFVAVISISLFVTLAIMFTKSMYSGTTATVFQINFFEIFPWLLNCTLVSMYIISYAKWLRAQ